MLRSLDGACMYAAIDGKPAGFTSKPLFTNMKATSARQTIIHGLAQATLSLCCARLT